MQDFEELSDYDFEQVVADLLEAEWKVRVERFPKGPDRGTDLRVLGPTGAPLSLTGEEVLIVQCKHRPRSTLAAIRKELEQESRKPAASRATRYVLVTSARLSVKNKGEIVTIFNGQVTERDVLGREDVDILLTRHPAVIQKNIKLWLANGAQLQAFLNQVENVRSASFSRSLTRLRSTFVETSAARKARDVINRTGICILSGPPGAGKTATASILLLQFMSSGWQPVIAVSNVRELESQLLPGVKQVLFFDDFLGQTALDEKLSKGEDSALLNLARTVSSDPDKAFVLTTRGHILQRAEQTYEKLNEHIFTSSRVTVEINGLEEHERARILYNQLYFSSLRPHAATTEDAYNGYLEVIRHPNYSPRLTEIAIDAIGRALGLSDTPARLPGTPEGEAEETPPADHRLAALDIHKTLLHWLDRPAGLWNHVLDHQLSPLQVNLLMARHSFGTESIFLSDLISAGTALARESGSHPSDMAVDMALRVLDGDLIALEQTSNSNERAIATHLGPGLADALLDRLAAHPSVFIKLASSAQFFDQVESLSHLLRPNFLDMIGTPEMQKEFLRELAEAARRTFLSTSGVLTEFEEIDGSLRPLRTYRYPPDQAHGRRLLTLGKVYEAAGLQVPEELADQIVPILAEAVKSMPGQEVAATVDAIGLRPFAAWQERLKELDSSIMARVTAGSDLESMALLRRMIDSSPVPPAFYAKLARQFELIFDATHYRAREILANHDYKVADPTPPELSQLVTLGQQWEIPQGKISSLASIIRQLDKIWSDIYLTPRTYKLTNNEGPKEDPGLTLFYHL
jgi:hypothetical protein